MFLFGSLRPALCVISGEGGWVAMRVDTIRVQSKKFIFWKIKLYKQVKVGQRSHDINTKHLL